MIWYFFTQSHFLSLEKFSFNRDEGNLRLEILLLLKLNFLGCRVQWDLWRTAAQKKPWWKTYLSWRKHLQPFLYHRLFGKNCQVSDLLSIETCTVWCFKLIEKKALQTERWLVILGSGVIFKENVSYPWHFSLYINLIYFCKFRELEPSLKYHIAKKKIPYVDDSGNRYVHACCWPW